MQNRLRHLQQLEMSFNRLEALPRLRKQKNLRVFNFASNKAAALEASTLTNLRSLKYFSAEQNQLATVDPVLFGITSLVYLNVADNNLSSDDVTGLSNLVNLTNLMVAYNRRLGAIPGLDSLTQVRRWCFRGKGGGEGVRQCPSIVSPCFSSTSPKLNHARTHAPRAISWRN